MSYADAGNTITQSHNNYYLLNRDWSISIHNTFISKNPDKKVNKKYFVVALSFTAHSDLEFMLIVSEDAEDAVVIVHLHIVRFEILEEATLPKVVKVYNIYIYIYLRKKCVQLVISIIATHTRDFVKIYF
ncbi:hypothetical protein ACJX0J_014226 [Zea mays]